MNIQKNLVIILFCFFLNDSTESFVFNPKTSVNGTRFTRKGLQPVYVLKRNPSIGEISKAVNEGANGLFGVVQFESNGEPERIGGNLISAYNTKFTDFTTYLESFVEKKTVRPLTMLMLDFDLKDITGKGKDYAASAVIVKLVGIMKKANRNFFVVLTVRDIRDISTFEYCRQQLKGTLKSLFDHRLAFGVSNGEPDKNAWALFQLGIGISQIWQHHYYEYISFPDYKFIESVNLQKEGKISKVIANSALLREDIEIKRTRLRAGAQGIITDEPLQMTKIFGDPEFRNKIRLATLDDKDL